MTAAQIDVIVPVHAPTRPVRRLVRSVVEHNAAEARILLIAHGTPAAGIRDALGEYADHPRAEVVEFADGVRSPAGPLAHGLSLVTAPWFTKIDSDDLLAPAALDSWLRTAERYGADVVLPRMVTERGGANFPTPPSRPLRRVLNPMRDRLAYRTSTMGLIASSHRRLAVPTFGVPTGEDVAPSLRLWFGARRIAHARPNAAYVVGEGAEDRVTESVVPMAERVAFVAPLLADTVWDELPRGAADAIVRKLLRVHVCGSIARDPHAYGVADRSAVADAVSALASRAPAANATLSRADAALLTALRSPAADVEHVRTLAAARARFLTPNGVLPVRPARLLARDAPLRFLSASVLASRRGSGVPEGTDTLR